MDVQRLHISPASFAILSSRIRGVWPTAPKALSRIPTCLGIVKAGRGLSTWDVEDG